MNKIDSIKNLFKELLKNISYKSEFVNEHSLTFYDFTVIKDKTHKTDFVICDILDNKERMLGSLNFEITYDMCKRITDVVTWSVIVGDPIAREVKEYTLAVYDIILNGKKFYNKKSIE